jgi:hypothetical protein
MYIVVYHWQLRPGCEDTFREGWRRVTRALRAERGSLGSRLHRADDGTWVAYAQWPSREQFERSVALGPLADEPGYAMMKDSVAPSDWVLPRFRLEVVDDLLAGG